MYLVFYYRNNRQVFHSVRKDENYKEILKKSVETSYKNHGVETIKHYCDDKNSKYVIFFVYKVGEDTDYDMKYVESVFVYF